MSTNPFQSELNIKESIMCTFAFFDLFDVALTQEQVAEFFLFSEADLSKINSYLHESPLILQQDTYFALRREVLEIHESRLKQQSRLWSKLKRWNFLLQLCPFVRWVAVCNSLSFGAADKNSDIDLFVVCKKKRMFLARAALTLFTSVFGLRRHGNKVAGRLCLSFYISEEALDLKPILKKPYDIYMAFWLQSMKFVAGDKDSFASFFHLNSDWLQDFFKTPPHAYSKYHPGSRWIDDLKSVFEFILDHDALDDCLRKKQLDRIYQKLKRISDLSGTCVNEYMLKFHNKDMRDKIRNEWVKRVDALI